jgi:hypothetical protein
MFRVAIHGDATGIYNRTSTCRRRMRMGRKRPFHILRRRTRTKERLSCSGYVSPCLGRASSGAGVPTPSCSRRWATTVPWLADAGAQQTLILWPRRRAVGIGEGPRKRPRYASAIRCPREKKLVDKGLFELHDPAPRVVHFAPCACKKPKLPKSHMAQRFFTRSRDACSMRDVVGQRCAEPPWTRVRRMIRAKPHLSVTANFRMRRSPASAKSKGVQGDTNPYIRTMVPAFSAWGDWAGGISVPFIAETIDSISVLLMPSPEIAVMT